MIKRVTVIISLILIFFIGIILIFYPNIRRKKQINSLTKEVKMCSKYLSFNDSNIDEIRDYIKRPVTSDKNLTKIEREVDFLLTDILDSYEDVVNILNEEDYKNILSITKDNIEYKIQYINDVSDRLETSKNKLLNIDIEKYITVHDENFYPLIKEKIDIEKIVINIENIKNKILEGKDIVQFLLDYNDYWTNEEYITFTKRKIFEEFEVMMNDKDITFDYKLIDDNDGPIINANNIIISQDDSINIYDYIGCDDEVDGVVECKVSGDYNNSNVGSYPIEITSKDKSNNTSKKTINVIVKEKARYDMPYIIEVVRNQSTIIVYGRDGNGEYTNIVGVFPCSPGAGNNTPIGTFYTKRGGVWGGLFGNVYGQYTTVITGHVLFHSVPYYSMSKDSLIWEYYNKLGTKVSMGCIRLTVRDAKWIYDNCGSGTMVKIYDGELPNGISKPNAQKIDGDNPNRGWDPTDPDPANPWNN